MNTTGSCWYMCYLPAPHRALFLSHGYGDWVEAVSCETGKQLWRLEGEVDGKKIDPFGVTLHPELQLLLVTDEPNNRILVLDPLSGDVLKMFTISSPRFFTWLRDQLLVIHSGCAELSYIRLHDPDQGKLMHIVCEGFCFFLSSGM